MSRLTLRLAFILCTLAAAACGGGVRSGEAVLATEAGSYDPGDAVAVTLTNGTEQDVGHNICFAFLALERRVAEGSWQPVPVSLGPTPDAACTMQIAFLPPGEKAESTAHLPVDLQSGTYRLATDVEVEGEHTVVQTEPFDVGD